MKRRCGCSDAGAEKQGLILWARRPGGRDFRKGSKLYMVLPGGKSNNTALEGEPFPFMRMICGMEALVPAPAGCISRLEGARMDREAGPASEGHTRMD